jgi:PAS domain S-box-containing protein
MRTKAKEPNELNQAGIEEALQNQAEILDLANDTIMIRDLKDHIVYWNQGAERLYGYSRSEALGSYVHTFLKTTFPKPLEEVFEEFFEKGHREGFLEHSKKDGERIIVASRWTLRRGKDGKPSAYLEINNDITARRRAEEELQRAHDELEQRVAERTAELSRANKMLLEQIAERKLAEKALRALSAQLISAQEEERRRISRDLRDDLGQILTAINLDLERALRLKDSRKKNQAIQRVLTSNQEARSRLKELSSLLRPAVLDDVGLKEAVQTYISEFSARTGVRTSLIFDFENTDISPDATTGLYRIIQEALTNITKHSRAKTISIALESAADKIILTIQDDGIGFDAVAMRTEKSLGLAGMKERAELVGGLFFVHSKPGAGTQIKVLLPMENGRK